MEPDKAQPPLSLLQFKTSSYRLQGRKLDIMKCKETALVTVELRCSSLLFLPPVPVGAWFSSHRAAFALPNSNSELGENSMCARCSLLVGGWRTCLARPCRRSSCTSGEQRHQVRSSWLAKPASQWGALCFPLRVGYCLFFPVSNLFHAHCREGLGGNFDHWMVADFFLE